ncbi:Scr1 family TA system antitoxin-like transcriptional regulator [Streptomyces ipomoeae]|nr:Scr1 family TA system antitoxin-like transcriptional regulator [Streptomyces ipomoeae]MDX2700202.1 Scr1 family TA system antitoxin-like transcriptional regulator [Streptomyces ipomoeae]MDX2845846.1 Scr1 family TA system antitoxin-like transcriptional regulator [Streptomyces ipomoeae]TQE25388.1 hypothetical protein Sipo7851_34705 [Streptomyces ipomoeae]
MEAPPTEAARPLGIEQNQVGNMEAGRMGVSPDRVRMLACHYECPDKVLVEALTRMTRTRERQAILFRDENPTPYNGIIHEAAPRIRAIAFGAGACPGSGQSVHYAYGPLPQLDTICLDQSHGLVFLGAEAQLHKYRTLFDRIDAVALSLEQTRDLIHNVMREM